MTDKAKNPEDDIDDAFAQYNKFLAYSQMSEYAQKRQESDLSCGGKFTKKFLVGMNMLFVVAGAGMIMAGLYLHQADAGSLLGDGLSYAVMALGGVIAIVAIIGACGAGCERRACLQVYAGLLILMICGTIAGAIYTFYRSSNVAGFVADAWDAIPYTQKAEIEQSLNCCGLQKFNDSHAALPCPPGTHEPCIELVIDDLTSHLQPLEFASIGIGAFLLFGIACSCSFLCSMTAARQRTKDKDEARKLTREQTRQSLLNPLMTRSDSLSTSKSIN